MYSKQTTVNNRSGLHARPASNFVIAAKKYESRITICKQDAAAMPVNAKSIARLLGQGIVQGDMVEIAADGSDAQSAVDELIALIETDFGE